MLRNDYLIERIRKKVETVSLSPRQRKRPDFTFKLWREASLMGAASLILQSILRLE